jgi:preprotein translocase subunit SecY
MIKKFYTLLFLLTGFLLNAQDDKYSPAMADGFRSEGKIYVVLAVIAIIFISLVFFVVYLERKVRKIEKDFNAQQQRMGVQPDHLQTKKP